MKYFIIQDIDMNSLGSRVKTLRKKKGLTQAELGYLSGVHHTNIGRIENREVIPQADVLLLIAQNLDTTVEWLLTGSVEHTSRDIDTYHVTTNQNEKLFSEITVLCQKLSEAEKIEVIKYINYIVYKRSLDTLS
ncbi:MAG TPA: helix-turn-helix transcriptional regulator [Lachnospiraceae bacterium]|nr:helix-turn-helix transcriptional regulator [Lachnospiraceae bacterium]